MGNNKNNKKRNPLSALTSVFSLHQPVLVQEVLQILNIQPNGVYLDATFGRGGHSKYILQHLSERGQLFALDRDPEAIAFAAHHFKQEARFICTQASFSEIKQRAEDWKIAGKVIGVLMDLGVSSPQLDTAERGFSFLKEGPLDMRMDPTQGMTAAEWIAQAREEEIADVLWQYGEERFSRRMARAIVLARKTEPITTTTQLAEIVKKANPRWEKTKHPATRAFQGIRIFINAELEELKLGLAQAIEILAPGGRLAVISFHSLEDRLVKQFMREKTRDQLSQQGKWFAPEFRLVGRSVKPAEEELFQNLRARSARLRVIEKNKK